MNKEHFLTILSYKGITLKFLNITKHDDELSAVLLIHLMFEKIIEVWVESITNNPKFFAGTPMTFAAKLQVAQNFQMPEHILNTLITLNKIRDTFGNEGSKENISNEEMIELGKISITVKAHSLFRKLPTCSVITNEGKKIYKDSANNIKLSKLFTMLYQEIIISVRDSD
ncbi:hypothetical protein [Serratia sp. M24T3]|uniref:hypothetical protein n=1 Tax=Serratia sp. M24T3 TaxID=932213 RepID=UPI00025BBCFC|nr:hypothetical protein [Serratia sp. M24T3]EIC82039.1 hypothetical protein SPM24T3_23924 [Serratia sp. M24T3]